MQVTDVNCVVLGVAVLWLGTMTALDLALDTLRA